MRSFSFDIRKPKVLDLSKLKKSYYLSNLEKKRNAGLIIIDKKIDEFYNQNSGKKLFYRDYSVFSQQYKFIPIEQSQNNALKSRYRYEYIPPKKIIRDSKQSDQKLFIDDRYRNFSLDTQLKKINNPYGPLLTKNNDIKNDEFSTIIGNYNIKTKKK